MKSVKIFSIEVKSKGKTLKELNLGLKDFTEDILDIATEDIVYVITKAEYESLSKKFSVCTCHAQHRLV